MQIHVGSHVGQEQRAKQRLMREAADLAVNPDPIMNAQPLEDDIFTWHANIVHMDVPFHFELEFTHDYPRVAPKVRPLTYIEHPNVFGGYICLDILTMSEETSQTPYRGWTPAYTIRSLLVQLHCFLFDVERGDYSKKEMTRQAKDLKCKCGHSWIRPQPLVECKKVSFGPGFYRTRRPALIRSTRHMDSEEICTLEEQTVVEIFQTKGNRVRVRNAKSLEDGWCSGQTASGRLLYKIKAKTGVYKARDYTKLYALGQSELQDELHALNRIGSCDKGSMVNVTGFVGYGAGLYAISVADHFTLKSEADQILILWNDLKFRRGFDEEEVVEYKDITQDSVWFHELYGLVLDIVFDMCDSVTAQSLAQVHGDFQAKLDSCKAYQLRNFRCFYSLKTMHDDPKTVLGFGVNCEVMPKISRATGRKRPVLQRMHPSFDLMSLESFQKDKCETNVWKDVKFNAFMPMYLCPEHGERSLPAAEKCILKMWQLEDLNNTLSLSRLLETFTKLMNTTIVNMMKNVMDLEVEELQLFDSIKALEGYMSFHHLLLAFTQRKPALIKLADEKVKRFIEEKAARDKEVTPDLGELIACLSISNYKWEDFLPGFMDECFQRDARWILSKYPGLRNLEDDGTKSCIRMTQSYQAQLTGKRMGMFQRFFLQEIASPVALEGNPDKCKILFEEYNSRYGRPVPGIARRLQLHSRKVLAANDWWQYFDLIGFCAPSSTALSDWLRNSIRLSLTRKYHRTDKILRYTENHIESPNYRLHLNCRHCMCAGGQVFHLDNVQKGSLMKPKERLDVAFVVDCTGSMSSWLDVAKRRIKTIVATVAQKTQFKKVRFGLVCYRDHGHEGGYGRDKYVTKSYEFTPSSQEMQKYVNEMQVGGGGNCEALTSGLHAAASLKWNNDAMRIIIHIGDQCAHGMGSSYDSYPDGCPDGHDALKIAHNLAKKGVVIYNVDCGYDDGLRQTFYHTLSYLTGGICVNITDANALSDIVVGASMEEEVQNQLSLEVAQIYDDVAARHPGAREDQLVYEITHRLKMQGVKVKSMLGNQNFGYYEMKQIECMAFCQDLTQVKAMQDKAGEYFDCIYLPEEQFVTEQLRYASENQVRTCLKRIAKTLAIKRFEQNGCSFRQNNWKTDAWKCRWEPFKKMSTNIGKFSPWKKLTKDQISEAHRNIKIAGKMAGKTVNVFDNRRTGIKSSGRGWRKSQPKLKYNKGSAWSSMAKEPTKNPFDLLNDAEEEETAPKQSTPVPQQTQVAPIVQAPEVAPQEVTPPASSPEYAPASVSPPPAQVAPQQPAQRNPPPQQPVRRNPPAPQQPARRNPPAPQQPARMNRPAPPVRAPQNTRGWNQPRSRRSTSQRSGTSQRSSQIRQPQPPNYSIPANTTNILSVRFNPRSDHLGLTVNMADGLILGVDPYSSLVSQLDGLCLKSRIIGLNNQAYNAPLFNHLRNMGHIFTITFAVVADNVVVTQTLNVPAQTRPAQNSNSIQRRSAGSSSGSPNRRPYQSRSRTPDRSARSKPAPVVPNLDMALKITTCFPVTVETLKQKLQHACVHPKEIKLVNKFCAYAVFDSTFSLRLAARSDLGQGVQIKLARESRV